MSGRIVYASPVGFLEIVSDGKFLTDVRKVQEFSGEIFPDRITEITEKQLREYFAGKRREFDIPLAPQGTDFQRSVWEKLTDIPFGETRSYGDIAKAIGKTSACRAVGNAVGRNPILIIIPCHRIIRSDGKTGGFSAGTDVKEFLLKLEKI